MSDLEIEISYWNSTGKWRQTYYSELRRQKSNLLTKIEKLERDLDCAEYIVIRFCLNKIKGNKVLDIACGVGRQIMDFCSEFPNIKFYGIDSSDSQINLLKTDIEENNIKNVDASVMNASELKSLQDNFDLIMLCNNSLGCIDINLRSKCLAGISQLISDEGFLLIGNFERFDLVNECYSEWNSFPVNIDYDNREVDLGVYKSIWRSRDDLIKEMKSYGFYDFYKRTAGLGSVYVFRKGRLGRK